MSDPKITRDVVLDLLPAVRSGTASADSRALVEGYLAADPELAARAATMPFPSAELEMNALHRTRRRLRRGQWALGFAIFLTVMPLSFVGSSNEAPHFLFADNLPAAAGALALAALFWMGFFHYRRALG